MSEITGPAKVREAYAFACMRCGHGWEQAYEIEHHIDGSGRDFVVYKADGLRVPSPLSSPTCPTCGGHVVRIMREGQVSSVRNSMINMSNPSPAKEPVSQAGQVPAEAADRRVPAERPGRSTQSEPADGQPESAEAPHHWRISDLLHTFRRK
jgi:hypothetical protein